MPVQNYPVRLGPAETALVSQLETLGDEAAAERLRTIGLPTRRVESYHYTDLKTLLRDVPALAGRPGGASPPALSVPGAFRVMIANGEVQDAGTAPAGAHLSGHVRETHDGHQPDRDREAEPRVLVRGVQLPHHCGTPLVKRLGSFYFFGADAAGSAVSVDLMAAARCKRAMPS